MHVVSTKKLSVELIECGKLPQRSEQDVAVPLTRTELPSFVDCKPETVKALTAMVLGLLQNTLSEDAVWLSMKSAEGMVKGAGVTQEEFKRVKGAMMSYWANKKAGNPLGGMF